MLPAALFYLVGAFLGYAGGLVDWGGGEAGVERFADRGLAFLFGCFHGLSAAFEFACGAADAPGVFGA